MVLGTVALVVVAALLGWKLWAIGEAAAAKKAQIAVQQRADAASGSIGKRAKSSATSSASASGSVSAETTASRPATLTVAAVGDMIFDRRVKDLVQSAGGTAPFGDVADDLAAADITVGNLESSLSERGTPNESKDLTLRGDPEAIRGLQAAGFDFLSVANDHVMDYGPTALKDSLTALDQAGIGHGGAGVNQTAAWKPATFEKSDVKVAYLAFSHIVPEGFIAQADSAGMASGKLDMERVQRAIRDARKTHDYVLVSFHWGDEFDDNANDDQISAAHKAVDAGADMVLAHHPHVIQGVEYYKKRLIAYSLGDFVFDHTSRKAGESFVLRAELGPDGVTEATAVPVYVSEEGKPSCVSGTDASNILKRLRTISKPLGTQVRVVGDQARLLP